MCSIAREDSLGRRRRSSSRKRRGVIPGKRWVSNAKSAGLDFVYMVVKSRKHGLQSHVPASHVRDRYSRSKMVGRGEGMLKRERRSSPSDRSEARRSSTQCAQCLGHLQAANP